MKAVVLAAGKGTRMLPLTKKKPKPLIEFRGKPLLEHVLLELEKAGFNETGIVIGYLGEQVRDFFGSKFQGLKLEYLKQKKQLGTADAVRVAEDFAAGNDFLCGNADVIVDSADISRLAEAEHNSVVLARHSEKPWKYGCLRVKGKKLLEIVEKPEKGKDHFSLVNAGWYKFSDKIFREIRKLEKSKRGELELTDAVNALAGKEKAGFVKAEEKILDIGSMEDLE